VLPPLEELEIALFYNAQQFQVLGKKHQEKLFEMLIKEIFKEDKKD
jgi:hypothetical protein